MRRFLVFAALSASLAACSKHDGDAALEDAGDEAASHEGGAKGDASEPEPGDDGGEDPLMDGGGAAGGTDAAMSGDASRPRDAGQDASGLRDAGPSTSLEGGSATSGCAGKAYKLCEDFESANVGAIPSGWTYTNDQMGNRPSVVSNQAHSGTKSLLSANQATGQARMTKSISALGASANKHWGRVFYRVKSPPHLPNPPNPPISYEVLHNTMVALIGADESRVVDSIVNGDGQNQFIYNLPDDSCCDGSEYAYASYDGKWHCAEWFIDASAKQYRFYYDGAQVTTLSFDPSRAKLGNYTKVVVGWISYQNTSMPYNQAWLDDLAIDDNRIGCD